MQCEFFRLKESNASSHPAEFGKEKAISQKKRLNYKNPDRCSANITLAVNKMDGLCTHTALHAAGGGTTEHLTEQRVFYQLFCLATTIDDNVSTEKRL